MAFLWRIFIATLASGEVTLAFVRPCARILLQGQQSSHEEDVTEELDSIQPVSRDYNALYSLNPRELRERFEVGIAQASEKRAETTMAADQAARVAAELTLSSVLREDVSSSAAAEAAVFKAGAALLAAAAAAEVAVGSTPQEPEALLSLHQSLGGSALEEYRGGWGDEVDSFRSQAEAMYQAGRAGRNDGGSAVAAESNPYFEAYPDQDLEALWQVHAGLVAPTPGVEAVETGVLRKDREEVDNRPALSFGSLHDAIRDLVEGDGSGALV